MRGALSGTTGSAIALLLVLASACSGEDGGTDAAGGACGSGASATGGGGGACGSGASATGGAGGTADGGGAGGTPSGGAAGSAAGLPVGIPKPTFGWEHDTSGDATLYVDNTNPSCDDAGPGSQAVPFCDLFRSGRSVTYDAGDVVHVLGGPYVVSDDYTLTLNGTAFSPVIVAGQGVARILFDGQGARASFEHSGSYGIVENLAFFHMTRHVVSGDHLVLRNVAVSNPPGTFIDFNPVVSVTGHDVLIQGSEIAHNRRANDTDSHGIQASEGSYNVWIIDNEIHDNNGDAFQGCHECFGEPPHHVYLGRNVMHDDRENAVDLKTIHDVVVSENVMYGYGSSTTSSGDAMVIGSNGYDASINQGPRRVWVLNNELRDSSTGVRIEASEDVWIVGNVFRSLAVGLQIDDKHHGDVVVAANTLSGITDDGVRIYGCQPTTLAITNNLVDAVGDRHLDLGSCAPPVVTIGNNLFWGTGLSVRVAGTQHSALAALEAEPFASGNLFADPVFDPPTLVPGPSSPALDAGAPLDALYSAFPHAASIDRDRTGTPRPAGGGQDIGAYERP